MNRYFLRVFTAYSFAVLVAMAYVPWFGFPQESQGIALFEYAFLWNPPILEGYRFYILVPHLLLEILSLTLVLIAAAVSLWGREKD